jgi:hypothetical protein
MIARYGQAGGTSCRGDSKDDDVAIVVLPNAIFSCFQTKAETAGEVGKAREGNGPCDQTTRVSQPRKTEEGKEEAEEEEEFVSYICLCLSTFGIMVAAKRVRFPVRVLFDAFGMLGDLWRRTTARTRTPALGDHAHLDLRFYLHLPTITTVPPLRC